MTSTSTATPKRVAFILMILFPLSFIVAVPWLKSQSDVLVQIFAGIASTGTIVASFVLAILKDQDLDEWHREAARFSNQWGWIAGGGLVAILQGIPPFQSLIIYMTTNFGTIGESPEKMILFAFMFGFMAVIIAQMFCTLALSKGWRVWMSREAS